ncbi:MAG: histidine phosphatase family protein [Candidatus Lokiarchaeota archaeon]|nr:histidine phosphatase family protein [Candidatus Lokiarchaeota archaeon]
MDIEKIWNEGDWTEDARQIIDGLKKFPDNSKIILILRHSHRNEPIALEGSQKVRLTPQGHAIAKKFGENLPSNRLINIFYSIIWRCEETAIDIDEGFKNIGGTSEIIGDLLPLQSVGMTDKEFFLNEFNNVSFFDIYYRWVVGFYNPEVWTPFMEYCQSTAHTILEQVRNSSENGLNIFVTHDFNVMALRFGWFGLQPKKWVKFLGGFAYTVGEEQTLLLDYSELKPVAVPHWWKKL